MPARVATVARRRPHRQAAQPAAVFGDLIVAATTLNRQPGEVLDQALSQCVTITRRDQTFALMRRELAAGLVAEADCAQRMVEVLHGVIRVCAGEPSDAADPYGWVGVFDAADLESMAEELVATYKRARAGEIPWGDLEAVLHEWQESAWAIRSPQLREALGRESREVPLTEPPPVELAQE